ncbi:hypothetical protein JAAARDRAFT_52243 [Jaapia argillacea MUCL 33604]|uniref:Uncharacterized protein n=1 Tax=Jaapia argillacea MUCL 33604 TaxID=933084 RepID=A0A067QL70_9AGAM|nr:hypothetical protein JAAARDRAFT_52243 [Jaapia argillacea MUCL 33604]
MGGIRFSSKLWVWICLWICLLGQGFDSLAMWLRWFFMMEEKLAKDVPQDRWQMIGLVTPFVHWYPSFYTPGITTNPLSSTPTSLLPNPTHLEPHAVPGQSIAPHPKSTKKSHILVTISTS